MKRMKACILMLERKNGNLHKLSVRLDQQELSKPISQAWWLDERQKQNSVPVQWEQYTGHSQKLSIWLHEEQWKLIQVCLFSVCLHRGTLWKSQKLSSTSTWLEQRKFTETVPALGCIKLTQIQFQRLHGLIRNNGNSQELSSCPWSYQELWKHTAVLPQKFNFSAWLYQEMCKVTELQLTHLCKPGTSSTLLSRKCTSKINILISTLCTLISTL